VVISSGAMWSSDVKAEINAAIPHVRCLDALGSTEGIGLGISVGGSGAARFKSDPMTRVVAEDGTLAAPGSGIIGRIARAGPVPLGYYKDPEKTARTFITIDGVRHVLPGDYGTIEADGTIKLHGRGNMVINSGGEKIFVEEIEEALKKHPAIDDALVFGMPDPVWGQAVTALVEAQTPVSAEFVEKVPRGPNGKANYEAARAIAAATHGETK
jgi:fatty-acyl-CoA synthase